MKNKKQDGRDGYSFETKGKDRSHYKLNGESKKCKWGEGKKKKQRKGNPGGGIKETGGRRGGDQGIKVPEPR